MAANAAQRLAAITACLHSIKTATNSPTPVKVSLTQFLKQHKVQNETLPALKELEILKFVKEENKQGLWQWNFGAGAIDLKLAEKVYEKIKAITQKNHSKKETASINPKPAIEVKGAPVVEEPKKNDKTGKKRGKYKTRAMALAPKEPQSEEPQKQVKAAVEQPKAIKTPQSKPKQQVVPKVDKLVITEAMGTVFTYKQLMYMGGLSRKLLTDVILNQNQTISNVKQVRFAIEGSNISIRFYNEFYKEEGTEACALITEVRCANVAIGLKEHGEDSTSSILKMQLIPVADPYKIL